MDKEENLFQNRLKELADTAYKRNIPVFTDFLNLNELNIFHRLQSEWKGVSCFPFGGYETAERQMIAFLPDALSYEYNYPISILKISPAHEKFAQALTHRDYLGTILGLQIERSKIGDILIQGNSAIVFCHARLSAFVMDNLIKVKHTNVHVTEIDLQDFQYCPQYLEQRGSIASIRMDNILSLACNQSRTSVTELIVSGKVYCNGKLVSSNSMIPKENDVISVRGFGKFIFCEALSTTKKGRIMVLLKIYVS